MFNRLLRRVVPGLILLALPSAAFAADEFSGFRIPANSFVDWALASSANGQWSRHSAGLDHMTQTDWRGSVSSSFTRWSENDAHSSLWSGSLSSLGAGASSSSFGIEASYFSPLRYEVTKDSNEREATEQASLATTQTWYPGNGLLGVTGGVQGEWSDAQGWRSSSQLRRSNLDPTEPIKRLTSSTEFSYFSRGAVSAGLSIGRVRNATGVFEARVLEDRLRALGALTRPLSSHGRQRLADLMYAHRDVARVSARPAEPVMDALERILFEDGALRDSILTGAELFRVTDPIFYRGGSPSYVAPDGLPASPIARLSGWCIGMVVTNSHSRLSQRSQYAESSIPYVGGVPEPEPEYRTGYSFKNTHDATFMEAQGAYHHPCGMRAQWDAASAFATPIGGGERGFDFGLSVRWADILADRWLGSIGLTQNRTVRRAKDRTTLSDDWNAGVAMSAEYLIVDRLGIGLRISESWVKYRSDIFRSNIVDPQAADWFDGGAIGLDLTYRFRGFARITDLLAISPPR